MESTYINRLSEYKEESDAYLFILLSQSRDDPISSALMKCSDFTNMDNVTESEEYKSYKYITVYHPHDEKIVFSGTTAQFKKETEYKEEDEDVFESFLKPTKISIELATFLGISGDMSSRPAVTSGIVKYVKEHSLRYGYKECSIDLKKPGGDALAKLLQVPDDAELTFFNLQRYLKKHFPKFNRSSSEDDE